MTRKKNDILVIGFALFSMFFGAGNMIFPPYLGMGAGSEWVTAFVSYYIADIGLAIIAVFAMMKNDGPIEVITGKLGYLPGKLMTLAVILCIGPLVAIPRTGATTFEMAVAPILGSSTTVALGSSIVFFVIILLLTIKESAVVDIVGKFLTPTLLVGLFILIVKGVITPIGPIIDKPFTDNIVMDGVISGYQTLDVLAVLVYGIIVFKSAAQRGYTDKRSKMQIIVWSNIIAAFGLLIVYCGLVYLGATTSTLYGLEIGRGHLVVNIIRHLLGSWGMVLLGIVVALACITTAIALTSASANFFSELTGGKVSYQKFVIGICVFDAVVTNFGLNAIIALASPILSVIYPGILALVALAFFSDRIKHRNVYCVTTTVAMLVSLFEVLHGYDVLFDVVGYFPFARFGFAWVLPSAIFCLGTMLCNRFARRNRLLMTNND